MGVTNDIARVAIEASLILELIEHTARKSWRNLTRRRRRLAPGAGPSRHLAGKLPVDRNTIRKRNPAIGAVLQCPVPSQLRPPCSRRMVTPSGRQNIVTHRLRLPLHRRQPVFDDVTDRHDADE
jgi:hypothetical protein